MHKLKAFGLFAIETDHDGVIKFFGFLAAYVTGLHIILQQLNNEKFKFIVASLWMAPFYVPMVKLALDISGVFANGGRQNRLVDALGWGSHFQDP